MMLLASMAEKMTPRIGWISNLQISGSIETNTAEKAVSWNIGPHGYKWRTFPRGKNPRNSNKMNPKITQMDPKITQIPSSSTRI